MHSVLVIEDEAIVAMEIEDLLLAAGYDVLGPAASHAQAIAAAERCAPDLVLADRRILGDINGIETGAEIRRRFGSKLVVLTAQSDKATQEEAAAYGASAVLFKPFQPQALCDAIRSVLAG